MAPSTLAGIVTACSVVALLITAIGGLITAFAARRASLRVEAKVDHGNGQIHEVHVMVDGQRTEMQTVIVNQQRQLIALEAAMIKAGLTMPPITETTGEPIVATAVIVPSGDED